MDRVLLKRLLGAGVLVALAVIVLPFILQGEGYKASLKTDIPVRPQPPQPLDTSMVEPPAEVRERLQPPPPLPVRELPPDAPEGVAEKAPESTGGTGEAGAAVVLPLQTPAVSEPRPAAEPAQPVEPPRPSDLGPWMIQLGSFSAESNALNLRGQVRRAGFPCEIEKITIEGRTVWRVRAGPFPGRVEADAALKRLQGGLNLGGMVMQVR